MQKTRLVRMPFKTILLIFVAIVSLAPSLAMSKTIAELKEEAQSGDIDAQFELGYRYLYGKGLQKDINKAREWLYKPAQVAGLSYAKRYLGLSYWEEHETYQHHELAIQYFGSAYEIGDQESGMYLGWMTARGMGTTANKELGISYLETAQKGGVKGASELIEKLKKLPDPPIKIVEGSCEIKFIDQKTYDDFQNVRRSISLTPPWVPNLSAWVCQSTKFQNSKFVNYRGKMEENKYAFDVEFMKCNMRFILANDGNQYIYSMNYDKSCHLHEDYGQKKPTKRRRGLIEALLGGIGNAVRNSGGSISECYEGDRCFEIVGQDGNKLDIQCKSGAGLGSSTQSIFMCKDGGWDTGGFTSCVGATSSLNGAGNTACGRY